MIYISYKDLDLWISQSLTILGLSNQDAQLISKALVQTSLWGIDSHGIARITHYLTRYDNRTLNKKPNMKFIKTGLATGSLDGDDGHGMIIMTKATEHAIQLAKEAGVGVVGVYNSSHCGAIGLYTRQITESGMVGFAFTHADALVVPHEGTKPFFGTNPISIAFPTEDITKPICMDMATSIVPWNYIMNARRENKDVPHGYGVDENGIDSTNPHDIRAVKPMAGHKGYALAFMVDMLCSVINGMNYGPNMTSMYKDLDKKRKLGSLVIAIDPLRFGGKDNFRQVASMMIEQIKQSGDKVLYPGQSEYIVQEDRIKNGIPMSKPLIDEFNIWSDKLGIEKIK